MGHVVAGRCREAVLRRLRWRRGLRPVAQIRAQLAAARAYTPAVTELALTSHRYTAGQAAALAWLCGLAADPLTYHPSPRRPTAADVRDLTARAQAALAAQTPDPEGPAPVVTDPAARAAGLAGPGVRPDDDAVGAGVAPAPYLVGIVNVCQWALRRSDQPPYPAGPGVGRQAASGLACCDAASSPPRAVRSTASDRGTEGGAAGEWSAAT